MIEKKSHIVFFTTIITLVCSLGFIATDIYLPSIKSLSEYFHDTGSKSLFTISIFMLGMAVAQIFIGFFSDRYGRRSILSRCLFLFSVASLACFYADNLNMLLLFRFFQGVFASAGLVLGQAIVADVFDEKQSTKILSIVLPLTAFSPAVAPLLGAYLDTTYGWRANFILLSAYSLVLICLLYTRTFPLVQEQKKNASFTVGSYIKKGLSELQTLGDKNDARVRKLFGFLLFAMTSNAIYFTFIAGAPMYFGSNGAYSVGLIICIAAFPYMISSFIGNFLATKISSRQILFLGLSLDLLGGALLLLFGLLSLKGFWPLLIPTFFTTFGNGLLMPISASGALAVYPRKTGTVSGVLGSTQLAAGALATYMVGVFENGTLLPLGIQTIAVACLALCYFVFIFRTLK